eukprot:COSAG03_NODE_2374_length_2829_cov_1.609890_2_plen_400_part_00
MYTRAEIPALPAGCPDWLSEVLLGLLLSDHCEEERRLTPAKGVALLEVAGVARQWEAREAAEEARQRADEMVARAEVAQWQASQALEAARSEAKRVEALNAQLHADLEAERAARVNERDQRAAQEAKIERQLRLAKQTENELHAQVGALQECLRANVAPDAVAVDEIGRGLEPLLQDTLFPVPEPEPQPELEPEPELQPNAVDTIGRHALQIFVRTHTGKVITLKVRITDTAQDIKAKIEERIGVSANQQQLHFAGKPLVEGRTLAEINIQKESTISMSIRHSLQRRLDDSTDDSMAAAAGNLDSSPKTASQAPAASSADKPSLTPRRTVSEEDRAAARKLREVDLAVRATSRPDSFLAPIESPRTAELAARRDKLKALQERRCVCYARIQRSLGWLCL